MAERRILYLAVLALCLVFYWAYQEWLSWLLLMGVVWLPWLSLILSLPSMVTCSAKVCGPAAIVVGQELRISYAGASRLPLASLKGHMVASSRLTGYRRRLKSAQTLEDVHCGAYEIAFQKLWVYDYLGLFRLRVRKVEGMTVLVRPKQIPAETPPDTNRYLVNAWRPKSGGGFAENHELRLYRPGDSLRQIHWKLSAKTGKLIFREPMEALRGVALLTMELRGTPAELDKKLGRLLWMSNYLLGKEIPHRIQCLTGNGVESFCVSTPSELQDAIDALLAAAPAGADAETEYVAASWQYHIGGDTHES